MQMPNVSNVVKDPTRKVTYDFLAYRKLSEFELRRSVSFFLSTKQGRKKAKAGTKFTIITSIGAREP